MLSNLISRRIALAALLGLAGCGFAPIYGEGEGYRGTIAYEADSSVGGFRLRERLEGRLGRSAAPQYLLTTTLRTSQRAAAITAEGDTSRFNIIGKATWALTDVATEETIETGDVEAFTSYSATGSTIATQSTRDDAETRLAIILADLIVSRVLLLSPDQPQ